MKILFHSLNHEYGSFGVDAIFHGLHKLGHEVIDLPKRKQCYADSGDNYFTKRNFWHTKWLTEDKYKDLRERYAANYEDALEEVDMIIFDNPKKYTDIVKHKPILKEYKHKMTSFLTNDSYTRRPLPNIRLDNTTPMIIREKSIQADNINLPEIKDFNLNFSVDEDDCVYTKPSDKTEGVFMSMSVYDKRKEYAKEYNNQFGLTKDQYYDEMRKYKYGLSCPGQGFKCQRDPELGGNTLLCLYKQPNWKYSFNDYRDGVNCIEYENLKELKEKIAYYDEHDSEYERVLKNCYEHTLKHCTKKGQARDILRWFNER